MPIATPQGTLDFKSVDKVTFVGASSNTVIDTTTGSLGVGVDGNGPTSNLHVVGHTRLEGDINMLHTSNTASIKLNSNVVTEFPRSKKFIRYPRVALTANSDNGYLVDASSRLDNTDWAPYRAFNTIAGEGEGWHDEGTTYSTGVYTGTNSVTPVTGTAVSGEWIKIQLPEKIKLEKVRLAPRQAYTYRMPKDATILGSINGTDWYRVTSWSGQTYISGNNYRTINVNSEQYYNYYVLVVEALGSDPGGNSVNIGEWELFGVPEYDPEAHGTDVVVKSVPNVPNTDFLDVFVDAGNASGFTLSGSDVTGVTDLSTPANTMTVNGNVTYNSANKAFVFPGTGSSYMRATLVDGNENYPLTLSVWFMMTDYNANSWRSIITVGTSATGEQASIAYDPNQNQLYFGTYGADIYVPHTPELGKWNHVAATFTGGSTTSSTMNVYLNGVNMGGVPNGTQTPSFTNNQFVIGGAMNSNGTTVNNPFKGQIANARFYRGAYTSDEIYQLYAYQKEYFGHGDLSMTLKAGRLGIGTSEPSAALDVRGDVHISGSLRKTRARMIRLEAGAKHFTLDGWQTYVSYGETWTAYSSDPLYSVSITGDYVSVARAINYRIAVQNQHTGEVKYFPSSSGWVKYHYLENTRLDGHGYLGIMSGLTLGDSYRVQLEVDPNSTNDYQWNAAYGTITGLVWD